ncbi:hypothetical protein R5W23_005644 [Gemmata sp. JC673]|uniref:BON domain-containing protein n=1 Tax=Gemmata algarum TaxID=2975278 RepID=A0ABU5EY05_9BACT|nr:hypothetical protein [Gemmata algarum]MDY3558524.1 hypothetical protein [Gemmata algarum]
MWRRVWLIAGTGLVLGMCFGCGLMAGLLGGTRKAYHLRYLEEREAVAPILKADPAFAGIELCERSSGGIYLMGEVPTPADVERLRVQVLRTVGEPRSREVMLNVSVRRSRRG